MEHRIADAAQRFRLTQLERVSVTEDRAVVFAQSEEYGSVVLKVDTDWSQLENAYRMLEDLRWNCAVPVIVFEKVPEQISRTMSLPYGIMLSKRIIPGTSLRKESSAEKRLYAFCDLFQKIHHEACWGREYLQWLADNVAFCKMYCRGTKLDAMARKAYSICAELYEKYPSGFLLHGDLHHDNILLNEDGTYLFLDPKAVTGPEILDTPRFLLNELGMGDQMDEGHIPWCIYRLHEILGYPREDLSKAFYVETVLANVWRTEDGEEPRYEELNLAESFLE